MTKSPKPQVKPKAKQVKTATKERKPTVKPKVLTFQQRVFVAEYIKDRNGTQAAIRAGYKANSAQEQASRLLSNAMVRDAIDAFVIKAEEKAGLTVERTLREVARLAFFDPRKLLREDGSPKPITELDDDTAACLAGLDVLESYEGSGEDRVFVGHVKKYKIADKNAALEKAMKHLGLYEKDNEQKPDVNVTTRVVLVPSKEKADVTIKPMKTGD